MNTNLLSHHQLAINNLVKEYQDDERFEALIIGGSVAKGCARPDSDIDLTNVEFPVSVELNWSPTGDCGRYILIESIALIE